MLSSDPLEGLEEQGELFGRNANPRVLDLQTNEGILSLDTDAHLASFYVVLNRVRDKVQ